ncbi:MAG: hypothetical protein R3B82_03305 [Sandaracinaceae bacterium]
MLDFRHCGGCGTWFPQASDSCPSCGMHGVSFAELFRGHRLAATGGIPLLAMVIAFFAPSPWGTAVMGAGLSPLLAAAAWLLYRRSRRDPTSFAERIGDVQRRLEQLDRDLEDTDRRLGAARADLEAETRERAADMLEREVRQDRRLQAAQRRLVLQLERRLEQLEVERFRMRLRYFEACRDARVDSASLALELEGLIRAVPADRVAPAWETVLEDARLLQRQLARGVRRLDAARRLDPLAYADVHGAELDAEAAPAEEGALDEQTDVHLERIERSFEALEEIAAELVGDPDASGIRLRVDDEVMAALDEVEAELAERAERISGEHY